MPGDEKADDDNLAVPPKVRASSSRRGAATLTQRAPQIPAIAGQGRAQRCLRFSLPLSPQPGGEHSPVRCCCCCCCCCRGHRAAEVPKALHTEGSGHRAHRSAPAGSDLPLTPTPSLCPALHCHAFCSLLLSFPPSVQVQVSNSPVYNTGRRLGKGGFGQVFLGTRSTKARSTKDPKPTEVGADSVGVEGGRG